MRSIDLTVVAVAPTEFGAGQAWITGAQEPEFAWPEAKQPHIGPLRRGKPGSDPRFAGLTPSSRTWHRVATAR
jgi:hypothetical protein